MDMNNCKSWQDSLENYLAGEISPEALASLREHSRNCLDCRDMMAAHDQLLQIDEQIPEPSERDFRAMRLGVMAQLSAPEVNSRKRSFWQDTLMLLQGHPKALIPLTAAVLVCTLLVGRWSAIPGSFNESTLVRELIAQASAHDELEEYFDQSLIYSNVSVKPQPDGMLAMSFDVARHMDISAPLESPLARTVLLSAILDPSRMGSRMQAMHISSQVLDPRLRDALVVILHSDPSLPMRLEALKTLSGHPPDEIIQSAFLTTLQRDQSVQLRLSALEILATRSVNPQVIKETINQIPLDGDVAVYQRALQLQETL
jgi:hypothetical protein